MDSYEATKVVMSRIQTLDPENASKIMGYILIQDQGEKEMIRLAFGPETLLLSCINQAKACLGLSSSPPCSNSSNPLRPGNPFPPRIMIPNNGIHLSSPSSPASVFQRSSPRPFSYAAALNGGGESSAGNNGCGTSPGLGFYGGSNGDFVGGHPIQDQLPFLVDDSAADPAMSPSGRSDSLGFHHFGEELNAIPSPNSHHPFHRRSCSFNDAAFLANLDDGAANAGGGGGGGGFGWRPCMYFARGHCKNGSSCKFLHTEIAESAVDVVGSPSSKSSAAFDELLRIKALQQQRLALMAHHPFAAASSYNKCMDFLTENQRQNAADEFRKYSFHRHERSSSEFSPLFGGANSSSRQIYLTFPADSTFKEEDVSNYFSTFGPVQDVRIPYQQKRMFGFVTFHYPETVKLILAKGNPHFVCDSRVLVKPYKEKGKIQEKKQQQLQMERDALSPSGLDSRDHIDLPFGPRILFSTQEMMLRRKLEQEAELQHVIELQGRRMMNLHLSDLKNQHIHQPFMLSSGGVPISSPR
ncbi:hypothetical protein M569_10558, partial [Genlisea aurea]